jgi:riboflavin transporter FmnP
MQVKKLLDTKTMVILALMAGLAFLLAATLRFPVVPAVGFLRYDPKDIVIVITGFLYGPLAAFIVNTVVALIQMFTTSATGFIGFVMNVISGTAFACTAAFVYGRKRTLTGAIVGLTAGTIVMTGVMMLWNYIVTPGFMGVPREQVVALLVPGFLPFNLFNGIVNSAFTLLLYKPLRTGMQMAGVMPKPPEQASKRKIFSPGLIAVSLFILGTALLWTISLQRAADEEAVATAPGRMGWEQLRGENEAEAEFIALTNLVLPATGRSSTEVSWVSSNPSIIGTNGTVNRPLSGQGDAAVNLTATFTRGRAVSEPRVFTITVPEQ